MTQKEIVLSAAKYRLCQDPQIDRHLGRSGTLEAPLVMRQ